MSVSSGILSTSKLWDTIGGIQSSLQLTDERLAQILNISQEQLLTRRENGQDLPAMSLFLLADELELNFEDLIQQNFDVNVLKKQYFEDDYEFSNFFNRGANSRIFTLTNILKQAEVHGKIDGALKHAQLKGHHFENEYGNVSVRLIVKVIDYLKKTFRQEDFEEMGMRNILQNKNNHFGQTLTQCKNQQQLYETAFLQFTPFIEKNFTYEVLSLKSNSITVNCRPNPELVETYKILDYTSPTFSDFRKNVITSLPIYLGYGKAKIDTIRSLHDGDSHFQWKIDFSQIKQPSSLLPSLH